MPKSSKMVGQILSRPVVIRQNVTAARATHRSLVCKVITFSTKAAVAVAVVVAAVVVVATVVVVAVAVVVAAVVVVVAASDDERDAANLIPYDNRPDGSQRLGSRLLLLTPRSID